MGRYAGVVAGSIVMLAGIVGLLNWWSDFVILLKGMIPAIMIFAGAISVIAALSEIKDEAAAKREEKK
ncbi:MAG: hypothetical protein JXB40_02515 [Candidatus Omnitrophica bacterium]|nr:hypothetical protein [Candidatus Omnitrophota bacterium]